MGVGVPCLIYDIYVCKVITFKFLGIKTVWIYGSSIVYWARRRACLRDLGPTFGLQHRRVEIRWKGIRGMSWYALTATVEDEIKFIPPPNLLVIQLGSNDLGKKKGCELINDMKRDLLRLHLLLPNTKIVWSDILMRRYWHVAEKDGKVIENMRLRVNSAIRTFIRKEGHCILRHPNIRSNELRLYRADGTHLTDLGNDIYLNNLQGALETFLFTGKTEFPELNSVC